VSPTVEILGAGPAGLAAAITVARGGGQAVVYERNGDVGLRFHGDFQGVENWTTVGDVLEEFRGLGIEPAFDCAPVREFTMFDPTGRAHPCRSGQPLFYLVRRGPQLGSLDAGLKGQAQALGVRIQFHTRQGHLPRGGIVATGPRAPNMIAVGMVFDTDSADGAFGAFSDALAPAGNAYLLIHRGRGTLAVFLFQDFHNENVYRDRVVQFFCEKVGLRMENIRPFGGVFRCDLPRSACCGNILVAGEAAGFQDAAGGFGMRYAILSGHLAARAILSGLPGAYDRLWRKRLAGLMRAALTNRFLFSLMGNRGYPFMVHRLARARDGRMWLHGYFRPRLWKTLLSPLAHLVLQPGRRPSAVAESKEGCCCTWCRCRQAAL
jgi:flavin-dependent dehydrogenase